METREQIILRYSQRSMNVLYEETSDKFYLLKIAKSIFNLISGNVFIFTGFYVNGHAETDGPIGAYFLAKALKFCGFNPIVITDIYCDGYFKFDLDVHSLILPLNTDELKVVEIIDNYSPVAMISIERCGRNAEGRYCNMKQKDISLHTSPLDSFFIDATCLTIGIGDGGNEIGMGNLYSQIKKKLVEIEPSIITCNHLILSTTSNWGAYGLISALSEFANKDLLPDLNTVNKYLCYLNKLGAVDGFSGNNEPLIDGFKIETDGLILEQLRAKFKNA